MQIQYSYMDFWAYNMSNKIMHLSEMTRIERLKSLREEMKGMNELDVAKFTAMICNMNQDKIENMESIRNIIDY